MRTFVENVKDRRINSSSVLENMLNKDDHNTILGLNRVESLSEKQLNKIKDENLTYVALAISISSALEKNKINDLE